MAPGYLLSVFDSPFKSIITVLNGETENQNMWSWTCFAVVYLDCCLAGERCKASVIKTLSISY